MGDVCGGSQTVSMVKKVMAWKNQSDLVLWNKLIQYNQLVQASFHQLEGLSQAQDELQWVDIGNETFEAWKTNATCPLRQSLVELRERYCTMRRLYREIGAEAGVPIEPVEQTKLADRTMALPGVVIAAVPGGKYLTLIGSISFPYPDYSRRP